MKTLKLKLLLSLAAPFILFGCSNIGKMARQFDKVDVQANPNVLEVHADSIPYTIEGTIPPGYFHKKATVRLEPTLRYSGKDLPLEPVYLRGERAEARAGQGAREINKKEGGTFKIEGKVPYDPEMKKSHMMMVTTLKVQSDYEDLEQCYSPGEDTLARGTITTSLTVKPTDNLLIAGSTKADKSNITTTFYYPINRSTLRDTTTNKQSTKRIIDFAKDTSNKIDGITIMSYASPDGEVRFNDRLATQRTSAAFNNMSGRLKKAGVKNVNDTAFVKRSAVTEDWEGFRRAMMKSNVENKDEIIRIIDDNSLSNDEKEDRIRRSGSWEYLAENIFPPLRRSEIIVHTQGAVRDPNMVRTEGDKNVDNLNRTEMLIYAANHPDTAVKTEVYNKYMTKYPEDWVGQNNYAVALIWNAEYDQAHNILQDLKNRFPQNDTIANNFGVANRFVNNYDVARENLTQAQRGGIDVNNNMGILNIKTADYTQATSNFESDRCDYNSALAYTLAGQYDQALNRIECKVDKNAEDFYLRAIIGARKGDRNMMTTSLTRAVSMEGSLRDRAREDLEFRDHWDTNEFKNSIR